MFQKSPVTPEARLQKLKEEIALRKEQRQQQQINLKQQKSPSGPPSREKTPTPTPETVKNKKAKKRKSDDVAKCDSLVQLSDRTESENQALNEEEEASLVTESPRKPKKVKKRKLSSTEQSLDNEIPVPTTPEIQSQAKTSRNENLSDGEPSQDDSAKDTSLDKNRKTKKGKKKRLSDAETLLSEMADDCPGKVSATSKKKKAQNNEWVKKGETVSAEADSGLDDDDDDDGTKESVSSEEENDEVEENMENTIGGFSILGNFDNVTAKPVKRKLPGWLANPSIIKGGAGLKRHHGAASDKVEAEDSAVFSILDDDLKKKLKENDIHHFFPVQRQFIPELWQDLKCGLLGGRYGFRPRDICVSAPTGSGKTLAYVLPIVQALKERMVPKIYAVVVLPVRDLAEQVYKVFSQYCAGTGLKVGLVMGKTTLSMEQDSLVKKRYPEVYHSVVDILVATPGRLVDHIKSTPGFDLSWLRFLVIDEADRMMEDIVKNDWLSAVEDAAYHAPPQSYFPCSRKKPGPPTMFGMCSELPLQKLLFSATLSHNPEKLEQLNLFKPQLMTSVVSNAPSAAALRQLSRAPPQEDDGKTEDKEEDDDTYVGKYTTPEGLTEYLVESSVGEKPLLMLHFLHNLKFRNVLCFTNSVEATHRLCLLVKLFGGLKVQEFSSRLPAERRKKIIRQFSKEKIDLLVCSDAMARGMDVDNVKYVISYDNPPYIKTYIHRVGRTARAGRAGTAISLLEKKEFFHFKKMMRDAGKWSKIKEMKFGQKALKPLEAPFKEALAQLPQIIKGEKKKDPKK